MQHSIPSFTWLVSYIISYTSGQVWAEGSLHSTNDLAVTSYFNWTATPALPYLSYSPCYDDFECARLEVPLDWTNASNANKVQLAIIRLPATVPENDPSFGGSILFNPGGPSVSGVDVMRWSGHGIRSIVDGEKHFELVSWDPRGMQHTTPPVSCFKDPWQRNVWTYRNSVVGPMDASNSSLTQKWALAESLGKICEQTMPGTYPDGSSIAQFSTTSLVARDMVEMIDHIEIHRSELVRSSPSTDKQNPLYRERPALLNFWGYSYGSYLGNTFASMFPSRVGRIILDSVVDTEDYATTAWLGNLWDFNKTLYFFHKDCFEAGTMCPLNHPNVTSPQGIAVKIEELLERLKSKPTVVLHENVPDIVTFADIAGLIETSMYYPTWSWPELANILADLLENNGTSISQYLQTLKVPSGDVENDELGKQLRQGLNRTSAFPPGYAGDAEAARAVLCGDGDDITHLTVDDWYQRLRLWQSQSPIVGWKWSENPMMCAHWPKSLRPAESNRFKGPWGSKLADYDSRASPLLFVGGTADPALPLANAYKAAERHEGARVLVQDAPGHCTGIINPSLCTWGHIKTFFETGTLPENNTVCGRDGTAWLRG